MQHFRLPPVKLITFSQQLLFTAINIYHLDLCHVEYCKGQSETKSEGLWDPYVKPIAKCESFGVSVDKSLPHLLVENLCSGYPKLHKVKKKNT